VLPLPPLAGLLAPLLALAYAAGWFADDQAVYLAPFPGPIRVRVLVMAGIFVALVAAAGLGRPEVSLAHAGGLLTALAWFRLRADGRRPVSTPTLPVRRPVMTPVRLEARRAARPEPEPPAATAPMPSPRISEADRIDRLLEKISDSGLASLSDEERQWLADYAERKRKADAGD